MWLVWTGGDDRLWDRLTNLTFGSFDLLKILSSYPGLKYSRDNRWEYLGLVNEPCFTKATGPDPKHYGLWLDQRDPNCPPDPFANAQKYPGVAVGARGKNIPVGSYYGEPTGIVGLRLFPNPAFDDGGGQALGRAALLRRPRLLPVEGSGAALPGRHVVRLLPRQRQPGKAAGQSRCAAMGKSERDRRRPVFLGRPHPGVERRPVEFPVPGVAHGAAGLARHLLGLDRQHQQPAHDERDLRSVAAAGAGQIAGGAKPSGPTISPTSSSTTSSRAGR